MRFARSTVARTSFATTPVFLCRVVGDKIIFKPDVLSEEQECRLGLQNARIHNLEDECSITFDEWRRTQSVPKPSTREMLYLGVKDEGQAEALMVLRVCSRAALNQPELQGWRDAALRMYNQFVRAEIAQRPQMPERVQEVAEFLANHQVKGDDVKKALKTKGFTFTGKVVGNYAGGYDFFDADGDRITFQQFLEALSSDEPVGHDTKAQISEVKC